jgi:hypothetical protein
MKKIAIKLYAVRHRFSAVFWTKVFFGGNVSREKLTYKLHDIWKFGLYSLMRSTLKKPPTYRKSLKNFIT